MRAWELLESENTEFETDLTDLLIAAKANGLTEVDVDDIVAQLASMGHSVTADSLVSSLESDEQQNDFIKTVTLNKIILKTHALDDETKGDYEDEEVDAERLATKTAMKGVKKKQKAVKDAAKDLQL